jgi:hypothetical protein
MGIFSTFLGHKPDSGSQLADLCFSVRNSVNFLDFYVGDCNETAEALRRLEFSRDIIMIFVGSSIVETQVKSQSRALQICDSMRRRYLDLVSPPPTSQIGDCLIREDELESVAQRVAPGTPIQKLLSSSMPTVELMMIVCDIRSSQFRRDFLEGALMTQQQGGFMLWLPAAKSFLSQIRGISAESIAFDDANRLCVAIQMPFGMISTKAQGILQ